MKSKRFSLSELLVVIAIIGMLASLLAPSLKSARDKAKAADCLGNEKQLYYGYIMYGDDNDDYLAPSRIGNACFDDLISSYTNRQMSSTLMDQSPLLRNSAIAAGVSNDLLECAGITLADQDINYYQRNYVAVGRLNQSDYNGSELFGPTGGNGSAKLSELEDSTGTYLFVDLDSPSGYTGYSPASVIDVPGNLINNSYSQGPHGAFKFNFTYTDGHAVTQDYRADGAGNFTGGYSMRAGD